jgi:hypothetical protein
MSDEARSGRPSASRIQDHMERADALIQEERQVTVSEGAEIPDVRQTETCNSQR